MRDFSTAAWKNVTQTKKKPKPKMSVSRSRWIYFLLVLFGVSVTLADSHTTPHTFDVLVHKRVRRDEDNMHGVELDVGTALFVEETMRLRYHPKMIHLDDAVGLRAHSCDLQHTSAPTLVVQLVDEIGASVAIDVDSVLLGTRSKWRCADNWNSGVGAENDQDRDGIFTVRIASVRVVGGDLLTFGIEAIPVLHLFEHADAHFRWFAANTSTLERKRRSQISVGGQTIVSVSPDTGKHWERQGRRAGNAIFSGAAKACDFLVGSTGICSSVAVPDDFQRHASLLPFKFTLARGAGVNFACAGGAQCAVSNVDAKLSVKLEIRVEIRDFKLQTFVAHLDGSLSGRARLSVKGQRRHTGTQDPTSLLDETVRLPKRRFALGIVPMSVYPEFDLLTGMRVSTASHFDFQSDWVFGARVVLEAGIGARKPDLTFFSDSPKTFFNAGAGTNISVYLQPTMIVQCQPDAGVIEIQLLKPSLSLVIGIAARANLRPGGRDCVRGTVITYLYASLNTAIQGKVVVKTTVTPDIPVWTGRPFEKSWSLGTHDSKSHAVDTCTTDGGEGSGGGGSSTLSCGLLGGSCLGCDGKRFSSLAYDECGVCGGDGYSCRDYIQNLARIVLVGAGETQSKWTWLGSTCVAPTHVDLVRTRFRMQCAEIDNPQRANQVGGLFVAPYDGVFEVAIEPMSAAQCGSMADNDAMRDLSLSIYNIVGPFK